MKPLWILVVLFAGMSACSSLSGAASAPEFKIENAESGGAITYTTHVNRVLFEIAGPRGIGSARITQTAGATPEQITLKLHLRALEHIKFSFDNQFVEIEIPTTGDDHSPRQSVPPGSPLYMPTKIVSRDNEYPIQDGNIEIELPRAYYESNARGFSIEWIDFYR